MLFVLILISHDRGRIVHVNCTEPVHRELLSFLSILEFATDRVARSYWIGSSGTSTVIRFRWLTYATQAP